MREQELLKKGYRKYTSVKEVYQKSLAPSGLSNNTSKESMTLIDRSPSGALQYIVKE